ncbi:MAG TPA: hypothetical protein VN698_05795 [Bacteroidia bacterium]|nr:hypothetical protein [Bacteroidia bacterium]
MRPLHHKFFSRSWLGISWTFRRLFWAIFLLYLGLTSGYLICATGLLKKMPDDYKPRAIVIYILILFSGLLWLIFYRVHKKNDKKESIHSIIEYLEELKEQNIISEENFIKEKKKFSEK